MAAAKLKWGKRAFDLVIEAGADGETLKQVVESLTGVPTDRQKLLCTKLWKGALKDDTVVPEFPPSKGKAKPFVVTLIGSAEKLIEKSLDERPLFEEDLTQEEVWRLRRGQDADAEMADAVDIVALQREVGMDRDDGKADAYQYNRLVTGLPQRQINNTLVGRKNGPDPTLKGEEAMTLGMELRRAWVLETLRVDAGRASCETSASAGVFSIQIKKSCLYGANKKGNHCCLRIAGPRPSGSECLADQRFCPKGSMSG